MTKTTGKQFVGDWSELATLWGIALCEDDKNLAEGINKFIRSHLDKQYRLDPIIKEDMMDFLDALIEGDTPDKPIFQALKKINDDWALVIWFTHSLELLWT